jgi:hypothetical protein
MQPSNYNEQKAARELARIEGWIRFLVACFFVLLVLFIITCFVQLSK